MDRGSSQILGLFQGVRPSASSARLFDTHSAAWCYWGPVRGWGALTECAARRGCPCLLSFPPPPRGPPFACNCTCMPGFLRLRSYPLACGGDAGSQAAPWVPFRELRPPWLQQVCLGQPRAHGPCWLSRVLQKPLPAGFARAFTSGPPFHTHGSCPSGVMVVSFGPSGCLWFALQPPHSPFLFPEQEAEGKRAEWRHAMGARQGEETWRGKGRLSSASSCLAWVQGLR